MKIVCKYLIIVFMIIMMCGCGKEKTEVIASEWIVSEGEPKENASAAEGDFYYDKTTNHLYQLNSKKWVLLGKISNGEDIVVDNTCSSDKEETECKPIIKTPAISVSEDGYLLVDGVKTGTSLKGEKGTSGDDGKDGKDGSSVEVTIEEDGYISINGIKLNFKEYKNGCYQITDNDADKQLDAGEEVKCGSEYFNVYYNDGTKVFLLSKYNLDVGSIYDKEKSVSNVISNATNIQNSNAIGYENTLNKWYGVINYSDSYYWGNLKKIYGSNFPAYVFDSNSHILNYLQNYKTKLLEFDSTIEKVRLITYEEAMAYTEDSEEYPWIYNTSFWTGTAGELRKIYAVSKDENIVLEDAKSIGKYGIRPVIEMLDENIQR